MKQRRIFAKMIHSRMSRVAQLLRALQPRVGMRFALTERGARAELCSFAARPPSVRRLLAGLLLVAGVGMTPRAQAQEQEFQSWSSATTQWSVGGKVEFWLDGHARRRSASTLLIARPAIGYRLLDNVTAYVGYAWIPTVPDAGSLQSEHRIWQQAILGHAAQGFAFALRPRLEQRFADGGDVGHRARLFARASWSPPAGDVMLVAWDEAFLQLNDTDWGASRGFDQNRLFVGVGFPSRSGVRFEVGYLNVLLHREPFQIAHVLAINGFFSR